MYCGLLGESSLKHTSHERERGKEKRERGKEKRERERERES